MCELSAVPSFSWISRQLPAPGTSQITGNRLRRALREVMLWLLAACLCSVCGGAAAAQRTNTTSDAEIDQNVLAELTTLYGSTSTILAHIDLTTPFATKSPWAVVVAKATQPDAALLRWDPGDTSGNGGPVSICFVKDLTPDCSEQAYRTHDFKWFQGSQGIRPFYRFFAARVVSAAADKSKPLLLLSVCTLHGMNGNCGVSMLLYRYNRSADRFDIAFLDSVARNTNGVIRFVENGPLQGSVLVAYPTNRAPFTYWVEVYKQDAAGNYKLALRYRGKTGYGDGNPLSVADSEMPTILHRFGYWKPGDPPPVPEEMPASCKRVFMRGELEWCE